MSIVFFFASLPNVIQPELMVIKRKIVESSNHEWKCAFPYIFVGIISDSLHKSQRDGKSP